MSLFKINRIWDNTVYIILSVRIILQFEAKCNYISFVVLTKFKKDKNKVLKLILVVVDINRQFVELIIKIYDEFYTNKVSIRKKKS